MAGLGRAGQGVGNRTDRLQTSTTATHYAYSQVFFFWPAAIKIFAVSWGEPICAENGGTWRISPSVLLFETGSHIAGAGCEQRIFKNDLILLTLLLILGLQTCATTADFLDICLVSSVFCCFAAGMVLVVWAGAVHLCVHLEGYGKTPCILPALSLSTVCL